MSNVEGDSTPANDATAPVDDGQGGAVVPEGDPTPAEPEYDYLDIDEGLASKYVKAKVDGEEISVPLNEALQGYQRQESFTRKTQELAELRKEAENALRLQQAMQTSPGLTIQVLAQQAGVSVEEFLGMTPAQQQQAVQDNQEQEYVDPLERQLAEERQARLALEQRIEQREADEYLRSQVESLKQTYGIGDDEVRAVVQQALQMNVGPESFPMIYQAQAYQKLQATTEAQQTYTQQQQADDEARRRAAAAQAATVTAGSGATNVTPVQSANGITSPRDAILAAFESLEARG